MPPTTSAASPTVAFSNNNSSNVEISTAPDYGRNVRIAEPPAADAYGPSLASDDDDDGDDVVSESRVDAATSDLVELLSKRTAIDVMMKLPVVVIPTSSQSSHAIAVDLGALSVANELRVVPGVTNENKFPAVVDFANFHWTNVNVAR